MHDSHRWQNFFDELIKNLLFHGPTFFLIFLLTIYLRFIHLRTSPGWFSDEGVFINIAQNLSAGRWQMFAILGSPMLIQRPPLYIYLVAAIFHLFGGDILILRAISATLSCITLILLYALTRKVFSPGIALLSALFYAILPWIDAYNRIGFSYNLLTPLFLLTLISILSLENHFSKGWLIAGSIFSALAFCTDFIGAAVVLIFLLSLLEISKRSILPALGCMLAILIIVIGPIFFPNPERFISDTQGVMASRVHLGFLQQIVNIPLNFGELLRRESWIVLGICGLFLLPSSKGKNLILVTTALILLVVLRTITPVGRGLHYLIPLFPIFSIGLASFTLKAVDVIFTVVGSFFSALSNDFAIHNSKIWSIITKTGVVLALFFCIATPILWWFFASVSQSAYETYFIFTGNDDLSFTSVNDAENIINFIKDHSSRDDLVLASPQIAWASPTSRAAEFPMAIMAEDRSMDASNQDIALRYAYDCSLENARYVILDPLARDFAVQVLPEIQTIIDQVQTSWIKVAASGKIDLYENPAKEGKN